MSVFSHNEFSQHEQVSFFHCPKTGLKAIISVHNTHRGPALGGCRMWAYESDEQALRDVLRLSRGMTYKAAVTDLPLGGGKSVIIGDSRKSKTPDLMRAMGKAVETFNGRYIIAEDVGSTVEDMNFIYSQTKHVVGISKDGEGSGDPSPTTALGVYTGLKAAVKHRLHKNDLDGIKVSVQGVGNVGYHLCKLLANDGAQLVVTDTQADKVKQVVREFGAKAVELDDIYGQDVDVFSPCALGATLNDATLKVMKAKIIAGGANNQLAEARHGDVLRDMKILYAPDYVINAGGLINVYYEYVARKSGKPYDRAQVVAHVAKIGETSESVFRRADADGISTSTAADRVAEQRFGLMKASKAA
ncbi:MAG: Glu/Leu/Phe/Val dehydrogenase [Pseudomonadota bacterium]